MKKWIVFWILTRYIDVPAEPQTDPYNPTSTIPRVDLVYHVRVEKDTLSKVFDTRESALRFVEEGEKRFDIDTIFLDSIYFR